MICSFLSKVSLMLLIKILLSIPFWCNILTNIILGGFFLSIAIQKCNLHKRIALTVLKFPGTEGRSIIGGFMLSSCLLSMWIMNTSTTIMLLPIGLAIITVVKESMHELSDTDKINFQVALLLGIAYAANIGGIATLIGTAPNMALNGFLEEQYVKNLIPACNFQKIQLMTSPSGVCTKSLGFVTLASQNRLQFWLS